MDMTLFLSTEKFSKLPEVKLYILEIEVNGMISVYKSKRKNVLKEQVERVYCYFNKPDDFDFKITEINNVKDTFVYSDENQLIDGINSFNGIYIE